MSRSFSSNLKVQAMPYQELSVYSYEPQQENSLHGMVHLSIDAIGLHIYTKLTPLEAHELARLLVIAATQADRDAAKALQQAEQVPA